MLSLALLGGRALRVGAQTTGDYAADAVKAAYLYQFVAYVEWPVNRFDEIDSPFLIGVMGTPGIGEELIQLARGRNIDGRPVEVRLLSSEDSLADLHLLFIGADVPRGADIAEAAASRSILIVTDSGDDSNADAAIELRIVGNRVRFEVFLDEAARAGLKLSSRLLGVALRVHGSSAE